MACKKFRSLECAGPRALLFALIVGTLPCASAIAGHVTNCHPAAVGAPTVEAALFCAAPVSLKSPQYNQPLTSEDYIIDELCEHQ